MKPFPEDPLEHAAVAEPAAADQQRFATALTVCTWAGLGVLVLSFAAQVLGWLPAVVPLDRLPSVWALPVAEYRAATGVPAGWAWLGFLPHADMAALAGIALLAGSALLCVLALLPLYLARGERLFAAICAAEALVIALAASGFLAGAR